MILIDGKKEAALLREELKKEVSELKTKYNKVPGLTVILIGDLTPSQIYVRNKEKSANEVGLKSDVLKYPDSVEEKVILEKIEELNKDRSVSGILVQLPLPKHIDKQKVIEAINPSKDVDGLHPLNVGLLATEQPKFISCTPLGVLEILKRYKIEIIGKQVVVLGRSNLVGRPLATLLSQKGWDATVTICHSKTRNLENHIEQADIVVAAIGQPNFVSGEMLKKNVVVIDVGINRIPSSNPTKKGKLCGDVDFESASKVASFITPVPGGVGPMTIAMLMKNTILAAGLQAGMINNLTEA